MVAWWDRWLRGVDTGVDVEPRALWYARSSHRPEPDLDTVPGEWRADTWPSPSANTRPERVSEGRKDVVTVRENARQLLNKCGDVEEPLVIESSGDELNLTLSVRSAEKAVSKRGIFAFFTGNGAR